jgi:hypothetical protein
MYRDIVGAWTQWWSTVGGAGDTTVRATRIPSGGGGAVSGTHFRVLILLGAPPSVELGEGGQSQSSDR